MVLHQPLPGSAASDSNGRCFSKNGRGSWALFSVAQLVPIPLLFHDLGSHIILGKKYFSAYIASSICCLQLNAI